MSASSSQLEKQQTYQKKVKGLEFINFLEHQGLLVLEEGASLEDAMVLEEGASLEDAMAVTNLLHPVVRLILSNTNVEKWANSRSKVTKLLLEQARAFTANRMVDVLHLDIEIKKIIEIGAYTSGSGASNLEADLIHGMPEEGILPRVAPLSTNTMMVGNAALGMSMMEGSSISAALISLHPDWFPNLALLQQKGSLAYLFSDRVFEDISTLIDGCSKLSADMAECVKTIKKCEESMEKVKEQMIEIQKQIQRCGHVLLFVGIAVGACLWFRRH